MTVEEILKAKGAKVVTTRPYASVKALVHMMKMNRIGAVVVSDDDVKMLGIISERDIVIGLADNGADVLAMKVGDVMTRDVLTCSLTDTVKDLMAKMTLRRVRHLPVVSDGKLRGVISIGDVVKNRLDEIAMETNVLRDYLTSR